MEEVSWRTQIFSGFFLVCIALIILAQVCAVLGFLGLSDSMGEGWPMQSIVLILVLGIIFGNTRKEPTALRARYQSWLANEKITKQPSPLGDQY